MALVGAPNAKKSALLHALTGLQVKGGRLPVCNPQKLTAGLLWFEGASLQLVEVPIPLGAAAGEVRHGRQLLAAVRNADFIALIASLREPLDALSDVLTEMAVADIARPCTLCLTGCDDAAGAARIGEPGRPTPTGRARSARRRQGRAG